MLGFNQDDHPYRMCNETGVPGFLELQIPRIPMVVIVTSMSAVVTLNPAFRYKETTPLIHFSSVASFRLATASIVPNLMFWDSVTSKGTSSSSKPSPSAAASSSSPATAPIPPSTAPTVVAPSRAPVELGAMETYHEFTIKYAHVVEQFMAIPDLEGSKQFLLRNADMRAPCVILPNKILSTRTPYLYINVTHVSHSEEPSRVHYAI